MKDILTPSQQIVQFYFNRQTFIFFILTVIAGLLLLIPYINFYPVLAPGDHGENLYAFKQVMDGDVPYRDFWWVYGPLMPYYYSLFLDFFGVDIHSILIGRFILLFLSGFFFYFTLTTIIRPSFAFLGTVWFYIFFQDFFYTFNHLGGILALTAIVYFLFLYFQDQKERYLFITIFIIILLGLIKINFGVCALMVTVVSTFLHDWINKTPFTKLKKFFYLCNFFIAPFIIIGVYFIYFYGMPIYEIRQCMPYLSVDHPHNTPVLTALRYHAVSIVKTITSNSTNLIFAVLINLSILQTMILFFQNKIDTRQKKQLIVCVFTLSLFYILNLHEFLASSVDYRTFWSKIFSMMLIFIFIATATKPMAFLIRFMFSSIVILMMFFQLSSLVNLQHFGKSHLFYFALRRANIYVGNPPYWREEVTKAVQFLENNLEFQDNFFALPYDPLYYFLTGKKSPTRQLIFFDHINIPEAQEKTIIAELEKNNTNWVLISSRADSTEPGLGTLGKTYCPLIYQYIMDNFTPVAQFGDWENPPGWAWPHGVRIYKRSAK